MERAILQSYRVFHEDKRSDKLSTFSINTVIANKISFSKKKNTEDVAK